MKQCTFGHFDGVFPLNFVHLFGLVVNDGPLDRGKPPIWRARFDHAFFDEIFVKDKAAEWTWDDISLQQTNKPMESHNLSISPLPPVRICICPSMFSLEWDHMRSSLLVDGWWMVLLPGQEIWLHMVIRGSLVCLCPLVLLIICQCLIRMCNLPSNLLPI